MGKKDSTVSILQVKESRFEAVKSPDLGLYSSRVGGVGFTLGVALEFSIFYFTMFTHPGKAKQAQSCHLQV